MAYTQHIKRDLGHIEINGVKWPIQELKMYNNFDGDRVEEIFFYNQSGELQNIKYYPPSPNLERG